MAALSHSESRRKYSWWWDSHISPKNSKWLQENLTDMDCKVKSMIKLIEEDADSFARRAEMYYKKRPELMKLVEEFYRAYRALAERYNHATCELRHAHRTIAKAFPDHQVPFELPEESPSKPLIHGRGPRTPETKFPVRALFEDDDELLDDLPESIEKESSIKLHEMPNYKGEVSEEAECKVRALEKALSDMQAEKEDVLLNYQQCLAKLSNMEGALSNVQMDSKKLDEKAGRAEIEVWTMKEALVQLEDEKKDGSVKHEDCLEKISNLEAMLFRIQDEAESDSQALKDEISKLEIKKEEVLHHHNVCLGKISVLENAVSVSENEASLLKENAKLAEKEVSELNKALTDLHGEKKASVNQYKCCLEKISKLEREILIAKEDVKRLNNDLLIGNLKFKTVEEKYTLLEMTNLSMRTEAENLSKKIANKDRELTEKQEELENLIIHLGDEHSHRVQIEATLNSLRNLHSRSQDDQIALAAQLKSVVQNLKDSEANKEILEEEIRLVRDENQSLAEFNVSCANSMENTQNQILGLREIKERLEKEVFNHVGLSDTLHQEITSLKNEIKVLNESYRAIVEQVEAAGLSPKCFGPSIKSMQDENKILLKRLENAETLMKEKAVTENYVLASSREEVKAMHESCRFLEGEKATLAAEKASLLSQLETITETMHNLLEKNAVLENSFSAAKVELEGLREKSKGLEEICELLRNERSFLLTERGVLASKLENVERRLKNMEKRYNGLERKYADLEIEKNAATCQVEELKVCLSTEKQERMSSKLQSDSKLAGLKSKIHFLQEENSWKIKELEEELEGSLKTQFEISILQKFMKEMEGKNCSLVIECQKHVEASKLADKLILGLESESLEQQVESKILLDEIEWLRLGIYRIFKALETDPDCEEESNIENQQAFENRVLENIEDLKCSVSKHVDDKQVLMVENSVFLTLLEQLESKGMEIKSENIFLEKEIKAMTEKLEMAEKQKDELSESNDNLKKDANLGNCNFAILEAEMESLRKKETDLSNDFYALEEAYLHGNRDKEDITKKFCDLKEEKYLIDQLNDSALMEYIATASQSEILRVFSEEKIAELNLLLEDLKRQTEVNSGLEWKMRVFMEKFELQESENLLLKDCGNKLERDIVGMRGYNLETEEKLLDTQAKLKAAENLNLKLCKTVDELESDIQESVRVKDKLEAHIFQLSGNNSAQKLEIESLHMVETSLESELVQLRDEIEEKILRERILSFELEEKNKEMGLWEASASAYYFDLQISAIDGIMYRDKLQELAGVHRVLEDENDSKNMKIEGMQVRICSMESEISELKSQLCAYGPVVDTLKFDVSVLEHNVVLQSKLKSSRNHDPEVSEAAGYSSRRSSSEILPEDHSLVSLQDLHMRIKVLGKLMQEMNKPTLHRKSSSQKHREEHATAADIEKPVRCLGRDKIKTKHSESRNQTMLMKDIPLDQISNTNNAHPKRLRKRGGSNNNSRAEGDQMLELWEKAAESSSCELTIGDSLKLSSFKMAEKDIIVYGSRSINSDPPSADSDMERELEVDKIDFLPRKSTENERRILDRLNSDAAKLENLRTTARIMREKMEETNNNKIRKSKKDVDMETVWEQFLEAEETIEYLVDLNEQLVRSLESCPSPDRKSSGRLKEAVRIRRRKVSEQARKGSERIGRLQLELQKIQYVLVKLEEEKSRRNSNFFRSKTVVLSDFIYNGKKNSGKRKKGPMCGCFRRASSRSGSS